jgi:hypothetical protein
MKSRIIYTDEPMGKLRVMKDFLPPPDKLVLKEENVEMASSLKRGRDSDLIRYEEIEIR